MDYQLKNRSTLRNFYYKNRMVIALLTMMVPGILYLVVNNYIPMVGLVLAFKRYNYGKGIFGSDWNGLNNFTYLFKTNDAKNIIRNTLGYNFVFIVLGNFLAVTVAVLFNNLKGNRNKKVYQTLMMVPFLISMVVVSYIAFGFLSFEHGYINKVFIALGEEPANFYTQGKYWPYILTTVHLWKNVGYQSIIYYAAAVGIDHALYEAATVDGANRMRQIWHITLPGIRGTIITLVLLAVGRIFYTDFGLFYQVPMRSGIISSVTDTIDVFVYKGLTQLNDIGRASAAGFLQSVIGFILVIFSNFAVRKLDNDNALF